MNQNENYAGGEREKKKLFVDKKEKSKINIMSLRTKFKHFNDAAVV